MATPSILTVVTAARSQDLVTLAVAQDELRDDSAANAPFLRRVVTQASAAIAAYCGRVFIAETVTEQFRDRGPSYQFFGSGQYLGIAADGAGMPQRGDPVRLRRYPVSSVASVVEDGATLTAGTDYELDAEPGFLIRLFGDAERPWSFQKLVVTYTGGYAPGAVPDDLQDAALRLIAARHAARGRDPMLRQYSVPGVLEETFWVGGTGDNGALPPEVAGLADQYLEVRS